MTAGVTIVLILVGLPLLAWWVGSRAYWFRLRPRAHPDAWRELVLRHRLSAADAPRVAYAVPRGLPLEEPPLRAAAVDWAERVIEQETFRWPASRRGRIVAAFVGLWVLGNVGFLLYLVLRGRPGDVNWSTLVLYAGLVLWWRRRRRLLRQAVERNQDEPATA